MTIPFSRALLVMPLTAALAAGCAQSGGATPVADAAPDTQSDTADVQSDTADTQSDGAGQPDADTIADADTAVADALVVDAEDAAPDAVDAGQPDTAGQPDITGQPDATDAGPAADAPTFTELQKTVFSGCGGFGPMGCHSKQPFGGGLDLTAGKAWASLVGVDSMAHPGILRVQPGSPEQSMLIRKLTNQLAADGAEGGPMPKGEGMIWSQPPYVQKVSAWIAAGAKDD